MFQKNKLSSAQLGCALALDAESHDLGLHLDLFVITFFFLAHE
jgi:hypothetical protein